MNKKMIVLLAGALTAMSATSALANFGDLTLTRVVYQHTQSLGTVEEATDLGNINTLLTNLGASSNGRLDLTSNAFTYTTTGDYMVAYFVGNKSGTNRQLWLSGSTDAANAPTVGTNKTSLGQSTLQFLYSEYGTANTGTVTKATTDASSYYIKAGTSGLFGTVVTTGSADASLANITASSPISQALYFTNSFTATNVMSKVQVNGVDLQILTNSDGTTSLVAAPATPIPAAAYLMGSGLMGLVGLRRKKKA